MDLPAYTKNQTYHLQSANADLAWRRCVLVGERVLLWGIWAGKKSAGTNWVIGISSAFLLIIAPIATVTSANHFESGSLLSLVTCDLLCSRVELILFHPCCGASSDDIIWIIDLHKSGMNGVDIAKHANLKARTVQNLIRKFVTGGSEKLPFHSHGSGTPTIFTPRLLASLRRQLYSNPTLTTRQQKETNPRVLGIAGVRAIQKAFHDRVKFRKVKGCKRLVIWAGDSVYFCLAWTEPGPEPHWKYLGHH